jgi:hypothetical protein
MLFPDSLDELTPDQHRRELAVILARGVLRQRHCRKLTGKTAPTPPAKTLLESSAGRLAVPTETVLSVHTD